jgi:XTP/dITP diphosphohydrolase
MRLSNQLVLASLNRHKLEEFQTLLSAYPEITLLPVQKYLRNAENLPKIEGCSTYLENAIAKARTVNQGCHYPALGDDSGLEVRALQGRPGVRSHRYATPQKNKSQDQSNIDLLLSEMEGQDNRSAFFTCTVALVIEGILVHATGTLEGTITEKPRGTQGFGYDPIFIPNGKTQTLGELTQTEKNQISHRSKAIHALMAQIKSHGLVFAKP